MQFGLIGTEKEQSCGLRFDVVARTTLCKSYCAGQTFSA